MMKIVDGESEERMNFFRVCVVLVFLEGSKEWFLGCVAGGRRKGCYS